MSLKLRNRSLLTVQDYTQREFRYLLDTYSGQPLAKAMLTQTTRAALAGPQEPAPASAP